jgi:hypothetical protein
MIARILEALFGKQLRQHTRRYLDETAGATTQASREQATTFLKRMTAASGDQVVVGKTDWGEPVAVPLADVLASFAHVTGGTGAGKTVFALLILRALIMRSSSKPISIIIADPKGDLFSGALFLLGQRLAELGKADAAGARELRRRIVILDFASSDPVSSYNVLTRWRDADPDFFAASRSEALLNLLPGDDKPSLGGSGLLRRSILLLSEFGLPIPCLEPLLFDTGFRERVVSLSRQTETKAYFENQWPKIPPQTIAALARRIEALFSSEGVRKTLSGPTCPDFRALQDEGRIVLIRCAGRNISPGVRRLLQGVVMSDLCHAVFARKRRETPALWMCDEAQNCFGTPALRDDLGEVLMTARAFGTAAVFLTQNLSTAVQDPRTLSILHTNTRWSFSMRGDPRDCSFLEHALPITGRRQKARANPYETPGFLTANEERAQMLSEIAALPDRVGYLWFKNRSREAVRITTESLEIPQHDELEQVIQPLLRDPSFGARLSRKEYDRKVTERDREFRAAENAELGGTLADAYRRRRGPTP